jgi:hypothetical protein
MMPVPRPAALLALLALSSACATSSAARQATLRKGLDGYALGRTPAQVWLEMRRFLDQQGFPLAGKDREAVGGKAPGTVGGIFEYGFETRERKGGGLVLETERGPGQLRIRAEAIPSGDGCQVHFTRLEPVAEMTSFQPEPRRDLDLELAFVRRLDAVAATRIESGQAPLPAAPRQKVVDAWSPLRHLTGAWQGEGRASQAHWTFAFTEGDVFLEVKGSPLGAPPAGGAAPADELGRISRDPATGRCTWRQFTSGGAVDAYVLETVDDEALVFVAAAPESLPAGSKARFTLGRADAGELLAIFERASPGQPFAVQGEVRLKRRAP